MASVTATARPDQAARAADRARRRRATSGPSRIGRLIVVLNLVGLAILVGGALLLNELRQGLVNARIESLRNEGQLIVNVIDKLATRGDPEPVLEADAASDFVEALPTTKADRIRLFDSDGHPIADSYVATDRVEATPLPPAANPNDHSFHIPFLDQPAQPHTDAEEGDVE